MKKNIIVGITGGISAYKTCYLIRTMIKAGYEVKVIMTPEAVKFINPLTFRTLSGNTVYVEMFEHDNKENIRHISLADWAEIMLIAPLSANTLAKITYGLCDNLLTTVVCAFAGSKPIVLAPAMNSGMWKSHAVEENIAKLSLRENYVIMSSQEGDLACGERGVGRMAEPEHIFDKIRLLSGR